MLAVIASRLSRLRNAYRLLQSGVFNADAYAKANPDIPAGRLKAAWHFVSFAKIERRPSNQSALAEWLLPDILSGTCSPYNARSLQRRLNLAADDAEAEQALADWPFPTDGLAYHEALLRQDYAAAYALIPKLPPKPRLLARHYFAIRHLRLDHLDTALTEALSQLETSDVSTDELVAIRDFYEASGCKGPARHDFYNALLNAVLRACKREARAPFQALWWVGLPITSANPDLDHRLTSLLPTRLPLKAPPAACNSIESLLSLATSNALSSEPLWICTKTGKLTPTDEQAGHRCLTVWLPGETHWRQADTDDLQRKITQAYKAALDQATPYFDYLSPVIGSNIFDMRKSGRDHLPFFAYHTITNDTGRALNIKEAALPGYYTFDSAGYSGWATQQQKALHPVETIFDTLHRKIVEARVTKYGQPKSREDLPASFVLLALQVPDDTVATLSYIDRSELIAVAARHYQTSQAKLLIKPHPKDSSPATAELLEALIKEHPHLSVTTAPIQDLLDQANAVIVANSGVGFEALLRLKPVITTAGCEYAACTLVATNAQELSAALTAVDSKDNIIPSPEKIRSFVEQYISSKTFEFNRFPPTFHDLVKRMASEK